MLRPSLPAMLLTLAVLMPTLFTGAAMATPDRDAIIFANKETAATMDAVSQAGSETIPAVNRAVDDSISTTSNLTKSALRAYSDTTNLALNAVGAAGRNTLTSYNQVAHDSANLTTNIASTTMTTYDSSINAAGDVGGGAGRTVADLTDKTGQNALDLTEGFSNYSAGTYDDLTSKLGLAGPLAAETIHAGQNVTTNGLDAASVITAHTIRDSMNASTNATTTGADAGRAAFVTYNHTTNASLNAASAAGRNAITSYQQVVTDSTNLTSDAARFALLGYFGAVNTTGEVASASGQAAAQAYFGTVDEGFALADAAGRDALGAYFDGVDAGLGAASSAGRSGLQAYDAGVNGAFNTLSPENALLRGIILQQLTPCDPATGGGFKVHGQGDCVGQGIISYAPLGETFPAGAAPSAAPESADGSTPPQDHSAYHCGENQYGFIAEIAGRSSPYEACYQLAPSALTGHGVVNFFGDEIGTNSVRIDYDRNAHTAFLIVDDARNNVAAFTVVVAGNALRYGVPAPFVVPREVTFSISGITIGLFKGTTRDTSFTATYDASTRGLPSFTLTITPDVTKTTQYAVEVGSFKRDFAQASLAAPSHMELDVRLTPPEDGPGSVDATYTASEPLTPLAITWSSGGAPVDLLIDAVPNNAHLNFTYESSATGVHVWGFLDLNGVKVHNVWLPILGASARLQDVPSISGFDFRQVTLQDGVADYGSCDASATRLVSSDTSVVGETQTCISGVLSLPGASISLLEKNVRLEYLPDARVGFTFGPKDVLSYKETESDAVPSKVHATVSFKDEAKDVTLENLVAVTFRDGATVGGGASGASGCSSTTKRDSVTNAANLILNADFAPGEGIVTATLGGIDTKLSGVTRISSQGDHVDLQFDANGGTIWRLDADLSSSCSTQRLHVDPAYGVIRLGLFHGDGTSPSKAFLTWENIVLSRGSSVNYHIRSSADQTCQRDVEIFGNIARESTGLYKLYSDVGFNNAPCSQWSDDTRLDPTSGPQSWSYAYDPFFGNNVWIATFQLGKQ
ncbi:MAG: hypothetical protein WDA16_05700 [Candidatus Thermoplasmatota archaeon]